MAIYSIKDLEKLSGIKAHTIRMWEQRYRLIIPNRTQTNIRYYEDRDLKFLLNVALLNKNGMRISKIARLSRDEIATRVAALSSNSIENNVHLDALTISMIEMNEHKFDKILSASIQEVGFEQTMIDILYPFLEKLSVLWLTGSMNAVQEQFISYLIRQKIVSAIDDLPLAPKPKDKFLLFLPKGESQELSLLLMHYLLKARNKHVICIGKNISVSDLLHAYTIHNPTYLYTIVTESFAQHSVQKYTDILSSSFPKSHILLSGYQVTSNNFPLPNNVSVLKNLDETRFFLDRLNK